MSKEDMIEVEGVVVEAMPNAISWWSWSRGIKFMPISPVSSV